MIATTDYIHKKLVQFSNELEGKRLYYMYLRIDELRAEIEELKKEVNILKQKND